MNFYDAQFSSFSINFTEGSSSSNSMEHLEK